MSSEFDDTPDSDLIPVTDPEMTSMSHTIFVDAVSRRVRDHFEETDMPIDFIQQFGPVYAQAIDNALAKFAAGQLKHGGDIRDRDLEADEEQEIIDLFMYRVTKKTLAKVLNVRL